MRVIVLGAGVTGVTSAWYLNRAGHEVVVVDRQGEAASETSFANGGQISVSQSEPWAQPHVLPQIVRWMGQEDAPLLFRLRMDPQQWKWGLRFLAECRPSRVTDNMRQMLLLGRYSRDALKALRQELHLEYEQQTQGIICLYESAKELNDAGRSAQFMADFGITRKVVSREELVRLEPALARIAPRLVGGTYCPDDESGNARLFTRQLAGHCAARGVEFRFNTRINGLVRHGNRIQGVGVTGNDGQYHTVTGDAYVVTLGSFSGEITRTAGLDLPVYPTKGYSITVPVLDPAGTPTISLTDEAHRIVIARMDNQLRIAGTAEFGSGHTHDINPVRCEALARRGRELFGDALDWQQADNWSGLRPTTPGNVPLIGRARGLANLYLNTGHGTLGWTESCGSGQLIADVISGRRPEVDFRLCSQD